MVCSITRGSANPIRAPGSAMFRSPSMAKEAVTPPVVGSVRTEINGTLASSKRARAAEILASCIRLITPSIMRAPPEAPTMTMGTRVSVACSMARVIASPTTAPMLPPMNAYSIELTIRVRPFNLPRALITASLRPVSNCACFRRDEYALRSTNFSGSVEARFASETSYSLSSRSCARRARASMRKCRSHLGQTLRFSSRSFFQMICRQVSHFTHSPSVRTLRSPEVSSSPDCRLNQVIAVVRPQPLVIGWGVESGSKLRVGGNGQRRTTNNDSVLDSPLRHHALFIGMLYLAHFGDGVSKCDNCRMGVPPGQDNVHHFGFALQSLGQLRRIEHPVTDGVIDFVQDDQVPRPGLDRQRAFGPGFFHHPYIFRVRLLGPNLHETTSQLFHDELVAESLDRIQFPGVPGALQKVQHQNAHSLTHRPQGRSHRSRGLALTWAGVHDDETTTDILHTRQALDCTRFAPDAATVVPLIRTSSQV